MSITATTERPDTARGSKNRATPWIIAILLALVSAVPIAVGIYVLIELAQGHIRPETIRHLASPAPVVLHVISAAIFVTLGALQFVAPFRRRFPNWHRTMGRGLLACGLLAGLSALWITVFYHRLPDTNDLLFFTRLVFSSAMVGFIILGFIAIRRSDVAQHRAWMMRAYAIGLGAGTQAFVFMVAEVIIGPSDQLGKALLMTAAWVINLAIAEWIIRTGTPKVTTAGETGEKVFASTVLVPSAHHYSTGLCDWGRHMSGIPSSMQRFLTRSKRRSRLSSAA